MDSRLKNIRPEEVRRFLEKHGFVLSNVYGHHWVYYKKNGNQEFMPQVIDNNKELYEPNINEMIRKSGIPKADWASFREYLKKC